MAKHKRGVKLHSYCPKCGGIAIRRKENGKTLIHCGKCKAVLSVKVVHASGEDGEVKFVTKVSPFDEIYKKAERVMGKKAMQTWMSTPRPILGGMTPLTCSKTKAGRQRVINLLGQIEHGVYP